MFTGVAENDDAIAGMTAINTITVTITVGGGITAKIMIFVTGVIMLLSAARRPVLP